MNIFPQLFKRSSARASHQMNLDMNVHVSRLLTPPPNGAFTPSSCPFVDFERPVVDRKKCARTSLGPDELAVTMFPSRTPRNHRVARNPDIGENFKTPRSHIRIRIQNVFKIMKKYIYLFLIKLISSPGKRRYYAEVILSVYSYLYLFVSLLIPEYSFLIVFEMSVNDFLKFIYFYVFYVCMNT